jgi:hypothetical protein
VDEVETAAPSLLVILPHTIKTGVDPILEIGAGQQLNYKDLYEEHVTGPNDGDPRPVVILMGCGTAAPDIPYESWIMKFRDKGAALVVGTGSTILGRHASTITSALVHAIAKSQEDSKGVSFGDLMLKIRRDMVADGILMALCLTSYGDTDWIV